MDENPTYGKDETSMVESKSALLGASQPGKLRRWRLLLPSALGFVFLGAFRHDPPARSAMMRRCWLYTLNVAPEQPLRRPQLFELLTKKVPN